MHRDDFAEDHPRIQRHPVDAGQLLHLRHLALERDRALRHARRGHLDAARGRQAGQRELVDTRRRVDAGLVDLLRQRARREVVDELAGRFGIAHAVLLADARERDQRRLVVEDIEEAVRRQIEPALGIARGNPADRPRPENRGNGVMRQAVTGLYRVAENVVSAHMPGMLRACGIALPPTYRNRRTGRRGTADNRPEPARQDRDRIADRPCVRRAHRCVARAYRCASAAVSGNRRPRSRNASAIAWAAWSGSACPSARVYRPPAIPPAARCEIVALAVCCMSQSCRITNPMPHWPIRAITGVVTNAVSGPGLGRCSPPMRSRIAASRHGARSVHQTEKMRMGSVPVLCTLCSVFGSNVRQSPLRTSVTSPR